MDLGTEDIEIDMASATKTWFPGVSKIVIKSNDLAPRIKFSFFLHFSIHPVYHIGLQFHDPELQNGKCNSEFSCPSFTKKEKKKNGTNRISRTKMEKEKQIRKFQTKWGGQRGENL